MGLGRTGRCSWVVQVGAPCQSPFSGESFPSSTVHRTCTVYRPAVFEHKKHMLFCGMLFWYVILCVVFRRVHVARGRLSSPSGGRVRYHLLRGR